MKTLDYHTTVMIAGELESLPEKYAHNNFNSIHEGYAVILEEVRELENEVFFGAKKCRELVNDVKDHEQAKEMASGLHKQRMREECIQIAAMCARFIQELT